VGHEVQGGDLILICPMVMVLVERVTFVGFVSVANITYVTGSAIEMM